MAVAQVRSATITAYDVTTTYKITINGKVVSTLGTGGTVTTTAAALVVLLLASTIPEFAEVTWSNVAGAISGTADTAGKPFTFTTSVSGGAGTFGSAADTTSSAGPSHWDTTSNWTLGTIPANGEDIAIENSDIDILYGLAQSGVTLLSLTIADSYTGEIGLPRMNETGSIEYAEYRDRFLLIGATTVTIGAGNGTGVASQRIQLDTGAVLTGVTVRKTNAAAETDLAAFMWRSTGAAASLANVINVESGSVFIGPFGGDTSVLDVLRVLDGSVRCGTEVTFKASTGTILMSGGELTIQSNVASITLEGGTLNIKGTSAIGTELKIVGGSCFYDSNGTLTLLNLDSGGRIDFSRDLRTRTVTTANAFAGGTILDPYGLITWTNGIDFERCNPVTEFTLNLGTHFKLSKAAVS